MKRTIGDYIVFLIALLSSVTGIVSFYFGAWKIFDDNVKLSIVIIGIHSIFFLGYSFYLISKFRKQVRYTSMFQDLNSSFNHIHSITRNHKAREITTDLIFYSLSSFCTSLSNSFKQINGHNIGVCIKLLVSNNPDSNLEGSVCTYCRDIYSKSRVFGLSDVHEIQENSDFLCIIEDIENQLYHKCYYFSNRLNLKINYKNSRIPSKYNNKPLKKLFFWPLSYKSTIVVPIVPYSAVDQTPGALRGFLCIDSPRAVVFNKRVDVEILKGVADGLYDKIDILHSLIYTKL